MGREKAGATRARTVREEAVFMLKESAPKKKSAEKRVWGLNAYSKRRRGRRSEGICQRLAANETRRMKDEDTDERVICACGEGERLLKGVPTLHIYLSSFHNEMIDLGRRAQTDQDRNVSPHR